jgi:hypothetical protein
MRRLLAVSSVLTCILVLAALVVALWALVGTAPGVAARPPYEQEKTELEHAAARGLQVEYEPATMRLFGVRVSTVDGDWAAGRLDLSNDNGVVEGDGLAIFQRVKGTWNMDLYDFQHGGPDACGSGGEIPIPVPVQLNLRLPSCPLGPARLGEAVTVPDAAGDLLTKPRSLTVDGNEGSVKFVEIGVWEAWPVNRGARANARGTLIESGGVRKRVVIHLRWYQRCGGELAFRRLEWAGLRHGEGVPGQHLHLTCPA